MGKSKRRLTNVGQITILNKHHLKCDDPTAIYIGRGSPLGNPYPVAEHGRDPAIELYKVWLDEQMKAGNLAVLTQLDRIANEVIDRGEAKLLCFCKPAHCHGDHIANVVLDKVREYKAELKANSTVCSCGKGYRSAYDGKCGHCRTRKEKDAHRQLIYRQTRGAA